MATLTTIVAFMTDTIIQTAMEHGLSVFTFTGKNRNNIPRHANYVIVNEDVKVIPSRIFRRHPNLFVLVCHEGVEKIEKNAFAFCPNLRLIIIPGVRVIERKAFQDCESLILVLSDNLERIDHATFYSCVSLKSIELTSIKAVKYQAFESCSALTDVKFGKTLETIECSTFFCCESLEQITIPLKNGIITDVDVFERCNVLKRVELVERDALQETTAALLIDEWRDDMNDAIDSINQSLPAAHAGFSHVQHNEDESVEEWALGCKATVISQWIDRVLTKIIRYKAEHRRILIEATSLLELVSTNDVLVTNVLSFLQLPEHIFDGEEEL